MTASSIVLILVAVLVVAVVIAALIAVSRRKNRTEALRDRFGSEYDRTVSGSDKKRDAERELADREQRHSELEVRPLSDASRQRYLTAWEGVQTRFIDSPVLALSEADALLTQMMGERGFPTDDVRSQEDMLSVEHAHVLEQFRAGHRIEQAHSTGDADTEQVRQGMLHFRSVFEDLVSEGTTPYPDEQQPVRTDRDATR